MDAVVDFEKPLFELKNGNEELKNYTGEQGVSLNTPTNILETNVADYARDGIYTPWERIRLVRHVGRPNVLDYIKMLFTDFLPLAGDRFVGDDPAVIGGIGRFEGVPVTVLGQVKGHNTKENLAHNFGMARPEGFRKCLRLIQQAAKFHRPVISFIDTPGAYFGVDAEEGGQAWAIAGNLYAFSQVGTPLITVITGECSSVGALALGIGDVLLMLENAVCSVVSPERCAADLWKDAERAPEAAAALKMTAPELLRLKLIDCIILEPRGGAHLDRQGTANELCQELRKVLQVLSRLDPEYLVDLRWNRLCSIGGTKVMNGELAMQEYELGASCGQTCDLYRQVAKSSG